MPVDDQDESTTPSSPEENAPEAEQPVAETRTVRRRGLRRYFSRRNAMWVSVVAVSAILLLTVAVFIFYRSGQVDRIIANQIVRTLATYGIRAEVGSFRTRFGPRTAEIQDIKLYDAQTGEQLGHVGRILATIRIEDLYALRLSRNVNLEALEIDGLELWVKFDAEGHSNFRNLRLPPPEPNRRILFSYSTARVKLNSGVIHYDDLRHELAGEARNLSLTVQPDDPNAPAESWMNTVEFALSNSSFVYDGRPVNNIDLTARGRVNQVRAEIHELTLRSPVAEARLQGTMDDWRNLRYQMDVTSTVDLTQASDVLQTGATLRGAGRFVGKVAGEGTKYRVEGGIESDALAADNVRLRALNVTANVSGDGKNYEAQGRAVAELLTAGDFQLNAVQLAGRVMGTGTDFRWLGDLRAAAARNGNTSIAGLIFSDASAEFHDGGITGTAGGFSAGTLTTSGASIRNVRASNVRFARRENGETTALVASAGAGTIVASGATVNNLSASGVTASVNPDNSASVTVDRVQVGALQAAGARTGSLNIAGVRLAVTSGGRIEGTSGDINAGTVAFNNGGASGRVENVRLARPVFVLESGGRYRASADLSLGGGVLGEMRVGTVRGGVVATNNEVQLNSFVAEVFGGRATGNATVNTARGPSRIAANFGDIDVGGLIAALSGRVVPVAGDATGSVNLQFPGTNFQAASGRLDARFDGETGNDASGRTPLTGDLALRADSGLFLIERANLQTGASELNASGQFSFAGDSNLDVRLNSTDASELQRVLLASGLAPDLEQRVNDFGIELVGGLNIDGTIRGQLDQPLFSGRASLDSLVLRGRNVGALNAVIDSTATEIRVTEGQLAQAGGGGVRFNATVPLFGENNISLDATLERADVGNLLAALLGSGASGNAGLINAQSLANVGPASGRISVTGLPGAMSGVADVRVGPGTLGNEPYSEVIARATFNGPNINLETLDARLRSGRVTASGTVNAETTAFNLRAGGDDVQLDLIASLFGGGRQLPQLTGVADFTASASGALTDPRSYRIEVNAEGRDVAINGRPAGTLTLVGRTTEDQKFNLQLTTGIFGQPQTVTAVVDLANEELPATVETTLTNLDLTPLIAALLPDANVRITGATGSIRLAGNLLSEEGLTTALSGRAEFTDLTVQIEDIPLTAERPLVVLFSPREITFERTRFTGPGTNILFGGTAALAEGGRQNFSVDGQLNLRVLNNLSPNLFLSGAARVGVRVTGSFADPRINGTAEVNGASVSGLISDERLTASNINGRVIFTANQAQVETLTGRLGGGRFSVSGGALLAGFRPSQLLLNIRADDVTVPFPDQFRTTTDANLQIRGTLDAQLIEGLVNVRRTEYTENIDLADLINRRGDAPITESGGGGGSALGGNMQLDLQIEGRDALVVRNNLADVVGSLSLRVRGPVDDPIISGRVTATRGTLNFRNDRYELTRAFVDLPARRDADPILNIQAESEIRGYRVIVGLTGPLSQPSTVVRSDPALPQVDVVSLITTGDLASNDQSASTLAQTGFGTATSLLTDTLINNPVQRATDKLFGLNRFEIDPLIAGRGGASPTARLTVGRQITRDLSVTYSTNVTADQNQVVQLEYRVSDRLSFVAQYQQGSTNTLRAQNNNFNFEIRFRKRF